MADENKSQANGANGASGQTGPAATVSGTQGAGTPIEAPLVVLTQYLKDMSFENAVGAQGLTGLGEGPTAMVRVDVRVQPMTPPDISVGLFLSVESKAGDKPIYVVECEYAGVFRLGKVAQEHMLPLIMIEAPRLLFPFARQIIADAVQNGGFPPLLIQPVDFVALFREKRGELMKAVEDSKNQTA